MPYDRARSPRYRSVDQKFVGWPTDAAKRSRPEGDAERSPDGPTPAGSGLTQGLSSPDVESSRTTLNVHQPNRGLGNSENAVADIDYLETGGVIAWDESHEYRELFWRLEHLQKEAREKSKEVPFRLGGRSVLVRPHGMGGQKQRRLTFVLECQSVMFAFSAKNGEKVDRRNPNFYLKVTGEPCLLVGAYEARDAVREMIADLGGTFTDEWVKRLDVCLDAPGLSLRGELMSAFEAGWIIGELPNRASYGNRDIKTGFTARSSKRCKLTVYDKLLDATTQHAGDYLQGMIDRRWGGSMPTEATRIEFQLFRGWLKSYGLDSADDVLGNVGSIVAKLTAFHPRPVFMLTDGPPDRENKHQSRSAPLPIWAELMTRFQTAAGEPRRELVPVRRGLASYRQLYWFIFGAITTAAARLGLMVRCVDDCLAVLRRLQENSGRPESEIAEKCEEKMRKFGTWDTREENRRAA